MGASPISAQAPPSAASRLLCTLSIAGLLVLLAFRITLGVDLSDEAYYIAFIDGWLKTGIAGGNALGIHQTAALLVYPLAKLYAAWRGGTEGLALFLRAVYLAGSFVCAFCFYRFVRELRGKLVGALSSMLIPCFIPFSLPSPSYNTIGMLAMIAALSGCGVLFLKQAQASAEKRHFQPWAAASACAWTVAVLAYPTLLAVQFVLLLCLLCVPPNRNRKEVWHYGFMSAGFQVAGAAVLLGIFGIGHLQEMLAFSNASLQVSSGLGAKIGHLAVPILQHPPFALLCLSAVLLGFFAVWLRRSAAGSFVLALLIVSLLIAAGAVGPFLFAQSHDDVALLAIFGASLWMFSLRNTSESHSRLLRVLAVVGAFGGLTTSATATNGLVNFAIGGFFLAILGLALAVPARDARSTTAHSLALLGVACIFLWTAFAFIYGEGRNPLLSESRRIDSGVFAGLRTSVKQSNAIVGTSELLAGVAPPAETVVALGRLPGIYLLTAMTPMALSTWDFSQQSGPLPRIEKLRRAFYAEPGHQPDVVVVATDPWTRPPSSESLDLLSNYVACTTKRFEAWTVELYVKRNAAPTTACDP